mmetsp:Transcript_26810/g.39693  ORF Transcript_26810/g.39693 Transcript_26810/m.39693 type:complete len:216 (+) Transcript_26810:62-709(+)|eukprot:CAMPEP_0194079396 /NCGR_PEP_ID=MMETSP0149-20130528/5616_1 /TAXON_ID=122233 /ORGANISM="Chaetoceros debilis, Strain MM31A-1" /LENGTH=215 /DNA_ID=CAMNT_0038760891 /DNA_START=50 /DNA_END=697 /DNA_ORIENTATION=-
MNNAAIIKSLFALCVFWLQGSSFVTADSQLTVVLNSCTGDTSDFEVLSADISCGGYSCTWGKEANFQGTYQIGSGGGYYGVDNYVPVITAYAWGMSVFNDTVDICDDVSSSSGSSCPAAGTYTFSTHADLPTVSNWASTFSSFIRLTLTTEIDFGDEFVQCTFSVAGRNQSSYYLIGFSAMGVAALLGFNLFKSCRSIETVGDGKEELVAGGTMA